MMGTNRFSFDLADVSWVLDDADLGHLLALLREVREVVLDLETTGLDEYAEGARIVLASFTAAAPGSDRPSTLLLPLSHPDSPFSGRWRRVMASVADILVEHGTPVVGQNIKFDARWVHAGTGTDISGLIAWDTRVSSHLLDETASTSLKERAPRTFGIRRWDDFSLKEPGAAERVPLIQLGEYAARDTYWTWALSVLHREQMLLTGDLAIPETPEEIEAARLGKLAVRCAMPTVSTLAAVEQRGILLDLEWAGRGLVDHSAEADRLSEALADRVDWEDRDPDDEPSFAPTSTWFQAWARAAVADGLLRVAALTPTGKPQWNKSVLVRQARSGSDTAIDLLAMRSHAKKAEFLSSWIAKAHGGVIRTTYNAGVVSTGRLSSSDPNMQQVTESLKPAFVPRAGNVFIDLDYSQIELRAAAFIARCAPMIEAFRRGDDLHRLLASAITGKPEHEVLPAERQAGKSANFGLLYGMGAVGFQKYAEDVYDVSFTLAEAQAIRSTFFSTWEGMAEWHARTGEKLYRTGRAVSPIGRVRRLPMIDDGMPDMESYAARAAINAPVQGFASDIMQIAAASIEGRLPGSVAVHGASIVATVHDSILVEAPEDRWEQVLDACAHRMKDAVPEALLGMGCALDVPLDVSAKVGTRWGLSDVASR